MSAAATHYRDSHQRHAVAGRRAASSVGPWLPLLVLPVAAFVMSRALPGWARMWCLALAIYAGCKGLTWGAAKTLAPGSKHLAYLFAWPGMDAAAFLRDAPAKTISQPSVGEWLFAVVKFVAGGMVLFGLARLVPEDQPYLVGWVGMVGLAFLLHFGSFHLISCAWRSAGVDARPLMNWPMLATSVSDYWGRRWNTAFRDLAHRFLFQPLAMRLGPRTGLLAGFLFSGIVHDLVISLPAGGGYGGPTLFFLLQAAAMLVERSRLGRRLGLGRGWRGWAFAMAAILLPAPLLFHPPFVTRVIVPFLEAVRAV
jgi:alginate O-acetyltransferase complex protein AlgI